MGFWKEGKWYRVFCGIDDSGKPIRKRASTIEDARRILATYRLKKGRYDADLLALPEKVKVEVYHVLMRCVEMGVSLSELLDYWTENHEKAINSKPCNQCVELYLQALKDGNRRPETIQTMRYFLTRFFNHERPIGSITFAEVKTMFDAYPTASKSNWKRNCSAFFSYCVKQKLCERNLAADLELPSKDFKAPEILTIEQVKKLLSTATNGLLTMAVICIFCGLRPTEYKRLKRANVDLDKAIITIDSTMAKTRAFRLIKIPPVALQWLKLYGVNLCKLRFPARSLRAIIGVKRWPKDVLRHTAASMMLARDQNADAVALQLGNSPAILHRHYKNLVTEQEASEFWSLFPEKLTKTNLELTKTC